MTRLQTASTFLIAAATTFLAACATTWAYSRLVHGVGEVDVITAYRLAIIMGIVIVATLRWRSQHTSVPHAHGSPGPS